MVTGLRSPMVLRHTLQSLHCVVLACRDKAIIDQRFYHFKYETSPDYS